MSADTAGIIAIGAGAAAIVALGVCLALALRLRKLRAAQQLVAGEEDRTVVEHAVELDGRLSSLAELVERTIGRFEHGDAVLGRRLDGAIANCGVVRYDAMGEMTGRQSSSVALLDSHRNGVILSSILHREQARLYAKPIRDGASEFDLSPEEQEALNEAMTSGRG